MIAVIKVVCPRCGRRLTVSANAPARLTCPSCLARIDRPDPPPAPMRVLPLEDEVKRDVTGVNVAILVAAGVLLAGIFAAMQWIHPRQLGGMIFLLVIASAIIGVLVVAVPRWWRWQTRPPDRPAIELTAQEQRLLHYDTAPPPPAMAGRTFVTQVIVGVIGTILLIWGMFYVNGGCSMALVPPALAIGLTIHPRTRGLGAGMLITFGIGCLILLGLCAMILVN